MNQGIYTRRFDQKYLNQSFEGKQSRLLNNYLERKFREVFGKDWEMADECAGRYFTYEEAATGSIYFTVSLDLYCEITIRVADHSPSLGNPEATCYITAKEANEGDYCDAWNFKGLKPKLDKFFDKYLTSSKQ